jgi:hypothetical protein
MLIGRFYPGDATHYCIGPLSGHTIGGSEMTSGLLSCRTHLIRLLVRCSNVMIGRTTVMASQIRLWCLTSRAV